MSAVGATTAPLRRASGAAAAPLPAPRQPRPAAPARAQLSIVAPRATVAGRTPFAVLVGGILIAGLMVLLLVHTLAAQDAFRVHDLNQRLATLKDTEQQLAITAQQAASPTELRARAEALGMRPSQIDSYRHTKDGRVVGTLTAIPAPVVAPAPTATAKATTKATIKKAPSKAAATTAAGHAAHHAKGHPGASHN